MLNNIDYVDSSPITMIYLGDGQFMFYPMNAKVIQEFLESERERKALKVRNYCGAV